jgi:hypothetical protein
MNALPSLLERLSEASMSIKEAREATRAKCVAAIRRLEAALVGALDGESLRNLPNIATPPDRFFALRVRNRDIYESLDRDALVLLPSGRLAVAGRLHAYVRELPLADAELQAEDVELVARAVERAANLHLGDIGDRMLRSAARYERLGRLAERLHEVVDAVDKAQLAAVE